MDWKFKGMEPGEGDGRKISSSGYDTSGFMPAQVPGNVQWDLYRNDLIENPYFGDNPSDVDITDSEWWYRSSFKSPKAKLVFNGVDYRADFYLDGDFVKSSEGMFSRTQIGLEEGKHTLAVRLIQEPKKRTEVLKCQMCYGWDFAPRFVTLGIWDKVKLIPHDGLFVQNPHFTVEKFSLEIFSDEERNADLVARIDGEQEISEKINLDEGKNVKIFDLPNLSPWMPYDRGNPTLHELDLEIKSDTASFEFSKNFGVREVERIKNPNSPEDVANWIFKINGKKEYIRGANWVPPDGIFGRIKEEDYEELIDLAKEANINMLRVWGGGLREKQSFYEICDREGILVWQDFPFACINYSSDEEFLEKTYREASDILKQLRHHPSLVMYCGGNEFGIRPNRELLNTLGEACHNHDESTPFHPVSPSKGDSHNWAVWHLLAPYSAYKSDNNQFVSEFGMQAVPDFKSVKKFIPEENLWPPDDMWDYRKAELLKLNRYAKSFPNHFQDLKNFVKTTQLAQAYGLKHGIESFRREKYENSGCIFWQLNDPWPVISWSVIDYYGVPKRAYEYVKTAYSPILPSVDYDLKSYGDGGEFSGKVWLINDTLEEVCGEVTVTLQNDEKKLLSKEFSAEVGKDSSKKLGTVDWKFPSLEKPVLKTFFNGKKKVIENFYDLTYHDNFKKIMKIFHWNSIINIGNTIHESGIGSDFMSFLKKVQDFLKIK